MECISEIEEMVGKVVESVQRYGEYLCITFEDEAFIVLSARDFYGDVSIDVVDQCRISMWIKKCFSLISEEEYKEYEAKEERKREHRERLQELLVYEKLRNKYGKVEELNK